MCEDIKKEIVDSFNTIPIDNISANKFFEHYGSGNSLNTVFQPFEKLAYYERLFDLLLSANPEKYHLIHKGTPFYFMSWLALDCKNFEKGLFYIDCAISEDIKNTIDSNWIDLPAAKFLYLELNDNPIALRVISHINNILESQINRFNLVSDGVYLTKQDFIHKFVDRFMNVNTRTIISAFYVFLLEYSDLLGVIPRRSDLGGSISPFIHHLFSGGTIFESILRTFYKDDGGNEYISIKGLFKNKDFSKKYGADLSVYANSLPAILSNITDNSIRTSFNTSSQIRNTTGHNLLWDDIFSDRADYELIVNQIINSVFYIISLEP